MPYLVLARKYRPQTFAEVIDQGHITRTLGNAIASGRVAHAILFAGPRGTGKTTVARVLAKALNCAAGAGADPCNDCRSCREITAGHSVDVYEIDGASNNSVDQIRELRENVKYMPAHSPYKIYIIDEVHMLSTSAFNALLKTLEEPPSHVLFMFATTEPHKIPITILSRCQRFDFRRVRLSSIATHLAQICQREGMQIDTASLDLIARESGGSVRDSLSLLDQILACGQQTITYEQVLETLGVIDRSRLQELSEAVFAGNPVRFLETLDRIFDRGYDIKKLYTDFLDYLRDLWVIQAGQNPDKLVDLPSREIEMLQSQSGQVSRSDLLHVLDIFYREEAAVRLSPQPRLAMEMAFFKTMHSRTVLPIDALIAKLDDLRREILGRSGAGTAATQRPRPPEAGSQSPFPPKSEGDGLKPTPKESVRAGMSVKKDPDAGTSESLETSWQTIIESISSSHPSLAATLKKCCLRRLTPKRVEVVAPENQFTSVILRREKNLSLLKKVCGEVFGTETDVAVAVGTECASSINDRRERNQAVVKEALNHPLIAEAIEIFNGKLLDVQVLKEADE